MHLPTLGQGEPSSCVVKVNAKPREGTVLASGAAATPAVSVRAIADAALSGVVESHAIGASHGASGFKVGRNHEVDADAERSRRAKTECHDADLAHFEEDFTGGEANESMTDAEAAFSKTMRDAEVAFSNGRDTLFDDPVDPLAILSSDPSSSMFAPPPSVFAPTPAASTFSSDARRVFQQSELT
jgi:hypothetical protein